MSQTDSNWSLPDEIKKRKTQELIRQLEAKQTRFLQPTRSHDSAPAPQLKPLDRKTAKTTPASLRTTLSMRAMQQPTPTNANDTVKLKPLASTAKTIPAAKHTSQVLEVVTGEAPARWTKRQRRTALIAVVASLAVCLFTSILAVRLPTAQALILKPLPPAYAASVVGYLKAMGLPFTDLRTFAIVGTSWNAREIVQFDIQRSGDQGTYLALSYDSAAKAGADAFRATLHPKFKTWKLTQINNILILAAPNASPSLTFEITNHLTQYLIAPYRSFIPTATPGGKKWTDLLIQ